MLKTDIKISNDVYDAYFRSDLGGNCYRLSHIPSCSEILRTPENEDELFSQVFLFGNPILFPCNRIRGGSFIFEGRTYSFPINEPSTSCHIHGELYKTPFSVENLQDDRVSFVFSAKEGEYLGFPHAFTLKRHYCLDDGGLFENVEITNDSDRNMPFMLAFHTTFNIPFCKDGSPDSCFALVPVEKEQLRDENYLPTLKYASGRERDLRLSGGNYAISSSPLSSLYEVSGERSVITDRKVGRSLVYEADGIYGYRMLWRSEGARFFVIEPQTCAIDCFHLEKSAYENGLIVIKPHETKTLCTRLAID